ncbi:nephrin-like protein, partial [Dinothrombium tinctorium]
PPKEVIITDPEGQRLEGTVGPYDEGSDLVVICEADGGKPLPSVSWWKNDVLLDSTYSPAPHGHIRNELRLSNLNRSDFETEITCKASNTNLTVPKQSSIILDMNLKPLEVKITTIEKPISVGAHTELQCLSYGSRPPAKITWWKGTQKMVNVRDTVSIDENVTLSTVSFVAVAKDNGRYVSCRAENVQMEFSAIENGRVLNVHCKYKNFF